MISVQARANVPSPPRPVAVSLDDEPGLAQEPVEGGCVEEPQGGPVTLRPFPPSPFEGLGERHALPARQGLDLVPHA